jgi:hypothetical protein
LKIKNAFARALDIGDRIRADVRFMKRHQAEKLPEPANGLPVPFARLKLDDTHDRLAMKRW